MDPQKASSVHLPSCSTDASKGEPVGNKRHSLPCTTQIPLVTQLPVQSTDVPTDLRPSTESDLTSKTDPPITTGIQDNNNNCSSQESGAVTDVLNVEPAAGQFEGLLSSVTWIDCERLAQLIGKNSSLDSLLIIDSRSFLDYNFCHIQAAVNICCSKIVKRRLQQDKVTNFNSQFYFDDFQTF
jgi:hypothetical protein